MSQNLQMSIKQEPVEWSDFEHESSNLNKSSIEVAVKPELIYSKGDTDEEGIYKLKFNLSAKIFDLFQQQQKNEEDKIHIQSE